MSPRPLALAFALAVAVLAALVPGAARAGLLEGNHPKVQQGTEAFQKGDWEGALKAYEEAQRELPNSPELMYDLGDVYMKLKRTDDARRSYEAALSKAGDSLKPRDYFNLGNSLVELDQKADAINAYRQALKLDPHFEPARHNLEVLLRKKEPPKNGPPSPMDGGLPPDAGQDGGTDAGHASDAGKGKDTPDAAQERDGGASDGGSDKSDGGSSDAGGKGDGGHGDGGQSDASTDGGGKDNSSADGGSPDASTRDGGTMQSDQKNEPPPKQVDVKRLLDAARRNEKQFLMQQHDKKVKPRARPEKDW
jgi:Ca-activated chloride channel family protein